MKTPSSNHRLKEGKEQCGRMHEHTYYLCCAACMHGEHPSEGTSGHMKDCKYYKSISTNMEQLKKEIDTIGKWLYDGDGSVSERVIFQEKVLSLIDRIVAEKNEEIWTEVEDFAFNLVEPCVPDCSPEEHQYHQGTWNSFLKLQRLAKDRILSPQSRKERKDK